MKKIAALLLAASAVAGTLLVSGSSGTANAVADDDWLGIVNTYRAMSGLSPVDAARVYGNSTMAVYLLSIPGGYIADRYLGARQAVAGGDGIAQHGDDGRRRREGGSRGHQQRQGEERTSGGSWRGHERPM